MFALQDGGWCASSATAWDTYSKYGQSLDCKEDGEGGVWANNVYIFQDEVKGKFIIVVYTAISINVVGSKLQAYTTRPNGGLGIHWNLRICADENHKFLFCA